ENAKTHSTKSKGIDAQRLKTTNSALHARKAASWTVPAGAAAPQETTDRVAQPGKPQLTNPYAAAPPASPRPAGSARAGVEVPPAVFLPFENRREKERI